MAAFTAVAAGVGLATTAVTTAVSFAQAAEQNQKKKEAEEAAANAMMEARKKLDVNYYEQLGIQKEPYELARRELLAQGALSTQMLAEGDQRALAGGVGRVQLAQQLGQEKVATAMQQEQTQLEKLVAGEDSRLRDLKTQLDLQEAIGAQEAAADAQRAEAMAVQQGLAGVVSLAQQTASLAPLYEKSAGARGFNRFDRAYSQAKGGASSQDFMSGVDVSSLSMNNDQRAILKQAGSIGQMSTSQYKDFMSGFSPQTTRNFMLAAGVEPTKYDPSRFQDPKLKYTVPTQYQGGTAGGTGLPNMYYDSGIDFNSQDPLNIFSFDKTLMDRPPYSNYGQTNQMQQQGPVTGYGTGIDFYSADPFNIY